MQDLAKNGLQTKGISYSYGAKVVLNDINFSVPAGSYCALLGLNGAGKSTLFSLLTGLFVPLTGTIEIAGIDLARDPQSALGKMGIVFQQSTLDLDLTAKQNLSYFAALHGMSGKQAHSRIDEVLERMSMSERASERARELNGGHRRRLEIARSLMHKPEVLLLDEPTVGLDAASRAAITEHVHGLCADEGLTVLWATHLVDEVRDDDMLIILHQGGILAQGSTTSVTNGRPLSQAFLEMTGSGDV